jgi:hypothetical protein
MYEVIINQMGKTIYELENSTKTEINKHQRIKNGIFQKLFS